MSKETKWTPGPWNVNKKAVAHVESLEHGIANCAGWYTNQIDPDDLAKEQEANAHLIAAAPELYDALEYCVDALGDEFSLPRDCIHQALLAMAKARGEQ